MCIFRDMEHLSPVLAPRRVRQITLHWHHESGRKLRARRTALGLTPRQLADLVSITPESLSRIENGMQAPRDAVRFMIAHALCVEVDAIWTPIPRRQIELFGRSAA